MTALQSSPDYVAFAGLRCAYAHLLCHLSVHVCVVCVVCVFCLIETRLHI